MPVVQQGSTNLTALVVPNIYLVIVPPPILLNGIPSNIVGMVGSAQWGPVGLPITCSGANDFVAAFGSIQNRKNDLGTAVFAAIQQGAANFRCIRVTDTTDAASTIVVLTNCITFNAAWTGTLGNSITVQIATGSKASSFRAIVGVPGYTPEVFDNIVGSGNTFWVNLAAAINSGTTAQRQQSNLITAVAGVGTTAPSLATYTLAGGTDGAGSVTSSMMLGSDTIPRKGMYALRNQKCSVAVLADMDDSTQWTVVDAFGLSEGIYMVQVLPAGTSIATAVSSKNSAGLDSYGTKLMHGDWIYWSDPVNNILRLISPQGFTAGKLATLSPEQSTLNKPMNGVVGSQKSGVPGVGLVQTYSDADLQTLFLAGIDVITNPLPYGYVWGVRDGCNSSSNASINGDNYTRLTNYIAATLAGGMGKYIGQLINISLFRNVRTTLLSFLANMFQQGQLGSLDGKTVPYTVICDTTNNPPTRTALGYLQCDVVVQYQAINKFTIVNLQGGQTVTITPQPALNVV